MRDFFLLRIAQTSAGAFLTSYSVGTMVFSEGKITGALSWPFTFILCQGLRMRGPVPFLLLYAFRLWTGKTFVQNVYCKDTERVTL